MASDFKMVFMPPQRNETRQWAEAIAQAVPDATIVVAEDEAEALREIPDADAAFGTIPRNVLAAAGQLTWLAAPNIAPPAGYYYDELIAHPVIATNFRGIFNEHIAAHILAFVLALARGLHYYIPRQLRHEYNPRAAGQRHGLPPRVDGADPGRRRHRRRDREVPRAARGDGDRRRRPHRGRPPRASPSCIARTSWTASCPGPISSS